MNLGKLFFDAGIPFVDKRVAGRPGTFTPIGVMNHHTAGAYRGGNTASLNVCINGRADLAGPLCQLYISREPKLYLITDDRANHAGLGAQNVYSATKLQEAPLARGPDSVNGNAYYYGIEVENDGIGERYAPEQLDLLFRVNAALCKAMGKNQNVCIMHREWTKRKVDMSWQGDLRGEVAKKLANQPSPPPVDYPVKIIGTLGGKNVQSKTRGMTLTAQGAGYVEFPECPYDKFLNVKVNSSGNKDQDAKSPRLEINDPVRIDNHVRFYYMGGQANGAVDVICNWTD